ncbi:hypothetical protein Tco_1043933 [Tanacetum coccineum]|uniref:Uncharacterized protein n=1 Tax=Tanacetum coccineum TaxID=301880 RepID=A0ABQ5GNS6_9ASTR
MIHEGVRYFLVILPPPSGQVIQTYSDADTMLQFMGVIAFDVGPPVFLFYMVGGNLALGALRGRGRGRGAMAVLSGPGGRCSGGRGALAALPGPVGRGPGMLAVVSSGGLCRWSIMGGWAGTGTSNGPGKKVRLVVNSTLPIHWRAALLLLSSFGPYDLICLDRQSTRPPRPTRPTEFNNLGCCDACLTLAIYSTQNGRGKAAQSTINSWETATWDLAKTATSTAEPRPDFGQRRSIWHQEKDLITCLGFIEYTFLNQLLRNGNPTKDTVKVDMSGKYGTSNAGAESVGVSNCNKVYKEAGNEAVMSISVDDCIDLDGKERSILAKVKDLSRKMCLDRPVGLPLASWAPEVYRSWGFGGVSRACLRIGNVNDLCLNLEDTECDIGAPILESMEVIPCLILWKGKDAEGPSLDESLENEEHLDVDSCDSDSPKNVNNDSVSPSSRVLREEDVRGVESDLVDSFEKASRFVMDSVLYKMGVLRMHGEEFGR